MKIRVFDIETDGMPLPLISSDARQVIWSGVGANVATLNYVILQPSEANTPHAHAESEDTIYIVSGRGSVTDLDTAETHDIEAGCIVHVDPGTRHAVTNIGDEPLHSVGGPCPPDIEMLRLCGIVG